MSLLRLRKLQHHRPTKLVSFLPFTQTPVHPSTHSPTHPRCCPNTYTCATIPSSPGLIGCCPSGSTCSGSVNAAAITTVTVRELETSTLAPVYVAQTSVVYVQATTTVQPVYVAQTTAVVVEGGGPYCSTLTENGPGLPTTRPGSCGTILIVSGAERGVRALAVGGVVVVVVGLQVVVGRVFGVGGMA